MRRLWIVLFWLLATTALGKATANLPGHRNNMVILIQPSVAGPDINPLNYWQPQWILWPPTAKEGDGGQLLSVATGDNWAGSAADFAFDPVDGGAGWRARDFRELVQRGHFKIRRMLLGQVQTDLLVDDTGSASPNALRLALNGDSAVVRPFKVGQPWREGSIMVTEASGWDQIAKLSAATTGRVLVVEYPPKLAAPWTRYWLKGHGWRIHNRELTATSDEAVVAKQHDFPVPGMIRARLLLSLISHPDGFEASAVSSRSWPGANRFLENCRSNGTVVAALWLITIVGLVTWGATLVANERSSHVAPVLLTGALLSPAIVDVAGLMGRFLGIEEWPVWLGLSSAALIMASASIGALLKKLLPRAHPLLATMAVGLVCICLVDPIWSFMSPVFFGRLMLVSPLAMGALFGYMTGCVACIRGCGTSLRWVGRAVCGTFLVGGFAAGAWWTSDIGAALMIPVGSVLVGEGIFRWLMLVGFAFWPASLFALFARGFVWSPQGLLTNGNDRGGINLAVYVQFLSSPTLGLFLLVAGGVALFGYRFFFHQIRMLGKLDARRYALTHATICAFAYGLLHPTFLASALVMGVGAMNALLFDAVQTM